MGRSSEWLWHPRIVLAIAFLCATWGLANGRPPSTNTAPTQTRWECQHGFRSSPDTESRVTPPKNASFDPTGTRWRCNHGFIRRRFRCVSLQDATAEEVRWMIVDHSAAAYPGSCPCPYNLDASGRRCGRRSAYVQPRGHAPLCYPSDITDTQVRKIRRTTAFLRP